MRCQAATMHIEATVVINVAITMGTKMSVGSGACIEARSAIMLTGMTCRPEACRQRNMIWLFDAVSLFGLISCRLSMAFSAKGVDALSSPRRLEEKFITICPSEGCPFGI